MNQDIKKKWINAMKTTHSRVSCFKFRSYVVGMVPDDDAENCGWCAIGALCDLFRRETGKGAWSGCDFHLGKSLYGGASVPSEVLNWANLSMEECNKIMTLSDQEAWSDKNFNSVIDYLEEL